MLNVLKASNGWWYFDPCFVWRSSRLESQWQPLEVLSWYSDSLVLRAHVCEKALLQSKKILVRVPRHPHGFCDCRVTESQVPEPEHLDEAFVLLHVALVVCYGPEVLEDRFTAAHAFEPMEWRPRDL